MAYVAGARSWLAYLSMKTGNGGIASLAPSKDNEIHLPAPLKLTVISCLFNPYKNKVRDT